MLCVKRAIFYSWTILTHVRIHIWIQLDIRCAQLTIPLITQCTSMYRYVGRYKHKEPLEQLHSANSVFTAFPKLGLNNTLVQWFCVRLNISSPVLDFVKPLKTRFLCSNLPRCENVAQKSHRERNWWPVRTERLDNLMHPLHHLVSFRVAYVFYHICRDHEFV